MEEIKLYDIENIKIGHAQDEEAATGCTVVLCEKGAPTGVDIRGGGPASRETPLLNPLAACEAIHGVLISGGSAFGLDAAGGVMAYLEERNIGFDVGVTKVPLVCTSCLFDLQVGRCDVRPNQLMGYAACEAAYNEIPLEGNVGAGMGATVGKYLGEKHMMKAGIGMYAVAVGELKVGALVAVNALGDVLDETTGQILAGLLNEKQDGFLDTEAMFYQQGVGEKKLFTGNTTLGVVITNAKFNKTQMNKIAAMAQNGLARTIRPVHTTADGDSVYAMSVGEVKHDLNVVGSLAATVVAKAINRAVLMAQPAYGLKASCDLIKPVYK